jgi:hypothetical protein
MKKIALAALATALLSSPCFAERFLWEDGWIERRGDQWIEMPENRSGEHNRFIELSRSRDFLLIFDRSRNFLMRFPFDGGTAAWITPDRDRWVDFKYAEYERMDRPERPNRDGPNRPYGGSDRQFREERR